MKVPFTSSTPRRSRDPGSPSWSSGMVFGLAFVFEAISLWVAWRAFRKVKGQQHIWQAVQRSKDPTSFTVVLEDSAALIGVVIAMAGTALFVVTENPVWDGAASVAIGVLLAAVAAVLARESKQVLVGEAASAEVVAALRATVAAHPQVRRIVDLITVQLGAEQVFAAFTLEFPDEMTVPDLEHLPTTSAQGKEIAVPNRPDAAQTTPPMIRVDTTTPKVAIRPMVPVRLRRLATSTCKAPANMRKASMPKDRDKLELRHRAYRCQLLGGTTGALRWSRQHSSAFSPALRSETHQTVAGQAESGQAGPLAGAASGLWSPPSRQAALCHDRPATGRPARPAVRRSCFRCPGCSRLVRARPGFLLVQARRVPRSHAAKVGDINFFLLHHGGKPQKQVFYPSTVKGQSSHAILLLILPSG
jgi:hypothetical protein